MADSIGGTPVTTLPIAGGADPVVTEVSNGSIDQAPAALPPSSAFNVHRLVHTVVRRGLMLDHPWRHAYLSRRWTGA